MLLNDIEFPEHVRAAIAQGKLWRAKEILRGHIGSTPYSPDLYEQYGVVLLEMQDLLQAGKYLYLSGKRRPEYELAIDIFLTRHGKSGKAVVDSFPSRAKTLPIGELPEVVRQDLIARGFPEKPPQRSIGRAAQSPLARILPGVVMIGCLLLFVFGVASMVAGMPIVLRFIFER